MSRAFDIDARLKALTQEHAEGRRRFAALQLEAETLLRNLTRIEGAMTVLREQGAQIVAEETSELAVQAPPALEVVSR